MKAAMKKKHATPKKKVRKRIVKVQDDIPDLSNDPYFVKKAEDAMKVLRRTGILKY